jgi:hypothetical protein
MRSHNSLLDFNLTLILHIYQDLVSVNTSQTEIRRDCEEIRNRYAHEGLSFLTKTLPRLGKAVDASLAKGVPLTVPNFKLKKGTKLPCFAWTFLKRLFSVDGLPLVWLPETAVKLADRSNTGDCSPDIREDAILALRALRQLCFAFYKLETNYSKRDEDKVITNFIRTEEELVSLQVPSATVSGSVCRTARHLICRVLCNADPLSGIPRHGKGVVSTGENPGEKQNFSRFFSRLDRIFKYDQWFYYNHSHLSDALAGFLEMPSMESGTAKVVLVPKDSRGPRLISCEPLEYQWIQQSLMGVLVTTMESHRLTKGYVNFTDQEVNRRLAIEGSVHQNWVTLDMKDASDRVSLALVKELFPRNWYDALYACRTDSTLLPNGTVLPLKKFAPMGSAVCFPVEALCFWALSVAALMIHKGYKLRKACTRTYVYGDDLIVDKDDHLIISDTLPKFGLMLNEDKCCTWGPFKESCGQDAFLGASVTPVRVRTVWSRGRKSSVLASYVALSNAMWERKYFSSAAYIYNIIQNEWDDEIPVVSDRDPGVIAFVRPEYDCRYQNRGRRKRYNRRLQYSEVAGIAVSPSIIVSKDTGWASMLRVYSERCRSKDVLDISSTSVSPKLLPTGHYAIAHRTITRRAWTRLI